MKYMYIVGLLLLASFVFAAEAAQGGLFRGSVVVEDGRSGSDDSDILEIDASALREQQEALREQQEVENEKALAAGLKRLSFLCWKFVVRGDDSSKEQLEGFIAAAEQDGFNETRPLAYELIGLAALKYSFGLGVAAEGSKFVIRPVCSDFLAPCAKKALTEHFYFNVIVSKIIHWFGLGSSRLLRKEAKNQTTFDLGAESVNIASKFFKEAMRQQREQ